MTNSSIWPIDRNLSGATTSGESEPGSDGNEEVLHISQTRALLEPHHQIAELVDCVIIRHSLGESYPSAEMQSMYTTAPHHQPTTLSFEFGFHSPWSAALPKLQNPVSPIIYPEVKVKRFLAFLKYSTGKVKCN